MKLKYKKYLYIGSYLAFLLIPAILSLISYNKNWNISFDLIFNPLVFIFLDTIILLFIMKKLKKEPYKLQIKILNYFKGWNYLVLFISVFIGSMYSLVISILDLFFHYIILLIVSIIPVNDDEVNGVEEFFNKYPERAKHKFYKNMEEIRKEYGKLEKEVEIEIPVMEIKTKEQNKEKIRKVISIIVPIVVIFLIIIGILLSYVEYFKQFNRGAYHYFEVTINEENIPVYYEQKYEKKVIPFIYKQDGNNNSYDMNNMKLMEIKTDINKNSEYIIDLKEYVCIDEKVRVPCTANNRYKRHLIATTKSKMIIKYIGNVDGRDLQDKIYNDNVDDEIVYNGYYINNITDYLKNSGIYLLTITNESDNIQNDIKIIINIIEPQEMIDN